MYIDPEQHIKSGDILVFDVSRCATKDLNYKFSVEILGVDNDKIYILESGESFIEQGCEVVNSIPKQLPKIKPGQYVLKSKVQYEGKFKNFEQLVLSNVFEIK